METNSNKTIPVEQHPAVEPSSVLSAFPVNADAYTGSEESGSANNASGLTQDEIRDPNQVEVTISDQRVPIIVLFGPGKCGKTMTQIRLARYLHEKGYTINPVRDFRPSRDTNYQYNCDHFSDFVTSDDAAPGNDTLSFMLLEVLDNRGNRICQILEAPGEHYHSLQNPQASFPSYINKLIASPVRKIWCITLEPNWIPAANCQQYNLAQYVEKIKSLKSKISTRDKVVFVYNKIDVTGLMLNQEQVNMSRMVKDVTDHFPGVFESFRNTNPITSLWRRYDCELVPFTTGTYNEYRDGVETRTHYTVGSAAFPAKLWNKLSKYIRG